MERVGDTSYLQQGWDGEAELLRSDDLQEILAQFESTAYLKDLNIFGGQGQTPYGNRMSKGGLDTLSLPESFLLDEATGKRKFNKDGKDSQKKAKKDVEPEPPAEALTEGEMAKRRENHNATERRRREKINEKIDELRKLLPGGGKGVNKAAVLHQTAERMKSLQILFNRLLSEKRRLENSRNELLEDVYRLRTALAHYQHGFNPIHPGAPPGLPPTPPTGLPLRPPHMQGWTPVPGAPPPSGSS